MRSPTDLEQRLLRAALSLGVPDALQYRLQLEWLLVVDDINVPGCLELYPDTKAPSGDAAYGGEIAYGEYIDTDDRKVVVTLRVKKGRLDYLDAMKVAIENLSLFKMPWEADIDFVIPPPPLSLE